jgi:2-succinyl-5-enolpyruvyl-6-hydroxy-3-cyclohexene-1-carboxylate synthase
MTNYYSSDKATQIVVALLKAHNIRYVIASPGTTNIALVGSMQYDPYFKIYSSADERSAAYMACGLAAETGEPVVITCTEATASRNYLPALTEAYYRKLPILVITGHHGLNKVGHLSSQTIDRSVHPNDTVKLSVSVNTIHTPEDEWRTIVDVNRAILELSHHGNGPVHINLEAGVSAGFHQKELPKFRKIKRVTDKQNMPMMPQGRVAVFIGSHVTFSKREVNAIDQFCSSHDAVVFCDHTSGYKGRYRVNSALIACQHNYHSLLLNIDLLIHIGEVSGDTYTTGRLQPKAVWRVSPDGELRDTFRQLRYVFEMDEVDFFSYYTKEGTKTDNYLQLCQNEYAAIMSKIPELPFSNIWVAKELHAKLPANAVVHFSIFNSLRSWNFFQLPDTIESSCNVGGFGIDGPLSTLIGASLAKPNQLHYMIAGDLAFFYDLNSLGNRHLQINVRIIRINNGRGVEFRKYDHPGSWFGDDSDKFFAAAGHYGNMSPDLVKHYAEDLGFEYIKASSKEELLMIKERLLIPTLTEKPMLLEVFTQTNDEIGALDTIRNLIRDPKMVVKSTVKKVAKGIIGAIK